MRRLTTLAALAALGLLTACGSEQPPANPASQATGTPALAPAATPAAPAAPQVSSLPAGARPLLGRWAADLANCGADASVITITETRYQSPSRSCDLALTDAGNGTYSLACGDARLSLTPIFAPTGEGIQINTGSRSDTVLRCTR